MWQSTLKMIAAHWRRLVLTGTAVVLGVAFVTGALVLTDTSSAVFDEQFADASSGVDLVIRSQAAFGAAMGVEVERDPLDETMLSTVRATPGVVAANGKITGSALLVVNGEAVVPKGPSVGMSWDPEPFNPFALREGRAPADAGEVVIDAATAAAQGIVVGERIAVQFERGQKPFTVVGLAGFGTADGLPNSTAALFHEDVAQDVFDLPGQVNEIQLVTDGPVDAVRGALAADLGKGIEIASAQDVAAASADAAKEQLSYIKLMLLVLAATALFVGAFLIANTFAIVVSQRTRELALLRAVGASGRQVMVSVLSEALAVGLAASAVGVGAGIAAARGLRVLLSATGMSLPDAGLLVTGRTIMIGLGIGVSVTVLSALGPSRRAARTAPIIAMREGTVTHPPRRLRVVIGAVASAAGVASLVAGATSQSLPAVGGAVAILVVGAVLIAPIGIGPLAGALGWPLTRFGMAGVLARGSAKASPRRTAATATALALGLSLVTFMTVVATSVKASMSEGYSDVITADVVVESARGEMLGGLSPVVHHHVSELAEVATASPLRFGHWLDGPRTDALTAVDPATLPAVADIDMVEGDLSALDGGGVILSEGNATKHGLQVGQELSMTLPRSGEQELPVVGIVTDAAAQALSTGYLVSLETYAKHFREDVDASVLVQLAPGVDSAEGIAAVRAKIAEFPTAAVRDQAEARAARAAGIDGALALVTVLLFLAVAIALLGIANTLGLSIVERTREVGLLRAVGMARRQVARMVRLEALLVALVGAVVGVASGLAFGWAAVSAMSTPTTAVPLILPAGQLGVFLVVTAIGGALAGLLPARRASRLDVLAAISSE